METLACAVYWFQNGIGCRAFTTGSCVSQFAPTPVYLGITAASLGQVIANTSSGINADPLV